MSSAVGELDAILQSMLNLKPPGVSGSKITAITSLCTANVQSESVLVQKIYTHFKKAPGSHKLGVLYVVDSVTRQWVDQARKIGQLPGSGAPDGTFAAGVTRVTELLPVLMNDLLSSAPEDQKARIRKLVDIWERSSTFPTALLSNIKQKLDAPQSHNVRSTTPEGSPPPESRSFSQPQQYQTNQPAVAPVQQDTSAILAALASMAKQNPAASAIPGITTQASMNDLIGTQNGFPTQAPTVNHGPAAPNSHAVNPLGSLFAGASNGAQNQNQNQNQSTPNLPQNPLAAFMPQPQVPLAMPQNAPVGQDAQQQFQLLQLLASQGVPPEQWATALQLLNMQPAAGAQGGASGLPFPPPPANAWGAPNGVASRDRDAYARSPPSQNRRRSRSPGYERRREASPSRRRDSPVYGDYGRNADARGGNRRGNEYRQRSPAGRRRRSPSPPRIEEPLPPPGQKNVEWDHTLPKGCIKVLSRTLFVGGVTSSESHLRSLFSTFGIVQTCIVNIDKRHAFVKMLNRVDSVAARKGMEEYKSADTQLRTKWGVGFGPRDCSDYQTGISVIPIERLTDADRKWMLTAEYGGTGGRPIESGMVVEEPDIEIGAGVSSKAISRRIATDQGGKRGPQSSRGGNHGSSHDHNYSRNEARQNGDGGSNGLNGVSNTNLPVQLPGFGFPSIPNGMPLMPAGFPFALPQQPNYNQGSKGG